MTQIGVIRQRQGNKATVRVVRKGACGDHCSMCGACNVGFIDVQAVCDMDVEVGDRVRLESSNSAVIGGMLCLFVMPKFLPILFYLIFSAWLGTMVGCIASITIFLACVLWVVMLNKNKDYLSSAQPRVVAKVMD